MPPVYGAPGMQFGMPMYLPHHEKTIPAFVLGIISASACALGFLSFMGGFICGVLSLIFIPGSIITGIIAMIFGNTASKATKAEPTKYKQSHYPKIGFFLGLGGISGSILAVLAVFALIALFFMMWGY